MYPCTYVRMYVCMYLHVYVHASMCTQSVSIPLLFLSSFMYNVHVQSCTNFIVKCLGWKMDGNM